MLYLEDFLELIDQLPQELRDRFTEMRELDLQVQNGQDQIEDKVDNLFRSAPSLSPEERNRRYQTIKDSYKEIMEHADEKVTLANCMYDLVERYQRKLDEEVMKFKCELEADSPGITEIIEQSIKKRRMLDVTGSTSTNNSNNSNGSPSSITTNNFGGGNSSNHKLPNGIGGGGRSSHQDGIYQNSPSPTDFRPPADKQGGQLTHGGQSRGHGGTSSANSGGAGGQIKRQTSHPNRMSSLSSSSSSGIPGINNHHLISGSSGHHHHQSSSSSSSNHHHHQPNISGGGLSETKTKQLSGHNYSSPSLLGGSGGNQRGGSSSNSASSHHHHQHHQESGGQSQHMTPYSGGIGGSSGGSSFSIHLSSGTGVGGSSVLSSPSPTSLASGIPSTPTSGGTGVGNNKGDFLSHTFSEKESRHGRPRKLTSRVQEMLKDSLESKRKGGSGGSGGQMSSSSTPFSASSVAGSFSGGDHSSSANNNNNQNAPNNPTTSLIDPHGEYEEEEEEEYEEEEDDEEGGDEEDENEGDSRRWCICNQPSYGEMVACDNDACVFEWFHYECVNITAPPKGKWFCPHCTDSSNRRRKQSENTNQ